MTASREAPDATGGITTQGKDLAGLERNVRKAVECRFEQHDPPSALNG